ncbi:MAG: hypothetical protein ABUS49_00030 [Acidobacteriota bacterium]
MWGAVKTAWRLGKGYRLHPWDSPYLKWRIETWSGLEASSISRSDFCRFGWKHRTELLRYLRWAGQRGNIPG